MNVSCISISNADPRTPFIPHTQPILSYPILPQCEHVISLRRIIVTGGSGRAGQHVINRHTARPAQRRLNHPECEHQD